MVISAAHYFNLSPLYLRWQHTFKKLRIRRLTSLLFNRTDYETALESVIKGGKLVNMVIPWDEHVQGYMENGSLIIQYEDLLCNPLHELQKIQEYLGVIRKKTYLEKIVSKNSFQKIKGKYKREGNKKRTHLLRKGEAGQWKSRLSKDQIRRIHQSLELTLIQQEYLAYEKSTITL